MMVAYTVVNERVLKSMIRDTAQVQTVVLERVGESWSCFVRIKGYPEVLASGNTRGRVKHWRGFQSAESHARGLLPEITPDRVRVILLEDERSTGDSLDNPYSR